MGRCRERVATAASARPAQAAECASRPLLALVLGLAGPSSAAAQEAPAPVPLPGIVVSGERDLATTPASVDRIDVDAVPARPRLSVSEVLRRVPGVAARDRQNLAQDVQLSIRGYGARSTFGVRGIEVVADGIPASMPDGQGQVSHVPLEPLAKVEVLRGPFSALYGNAAGGVIAFTSADPPQAVDAGARLEAGSDALWQEAAWWRGPWHDRDGGYAVDIGHLATDGYRDHSRADRSTAQLRLTGALASGTQLALTGNALLLRAEDPQGLTFAQAQADPRAASAGALAFDTRKRVRQQQLGLRLEHSFGEHDTMTLALHGGARTTFQMLSVPIAAQAAPGSGGGVVDLDRGYGGLDLRWRHDARLLDRSASLTLGVEAQRMSEHRRGYENFADGQPGVVGALRRDERDIATARDVYAEARWNLLPEWDATLGVRHSRIGFDTHDAYIVPGNPDDSGALDYTQTNPVAGLLFRPRPWLQLYANAGRGFETPTFAELAYRSDGRSGLNTDLRPARSDNVELGARGQHGDHRFAVAVFASRVDDELVVASNLGGRSTYANAGRSRRDGWELSAEGPLASQWHYAVALTRLDARYRDAFATCRAPPCTQSDTVVAAGNRIPGTVPRAAWLELRWTAREGLDLFAQFDASGRSFADDANTAWAPGYATLGLGLERRWHAGRLVLDASTRVDDVFDRRAIGSLIVNDANGRYFEPAPGRTWLVSFAVARAP